MDLEEGLKRVNKNIKVIIVCSKSPNNKCKEDFNGLCYYCHRNMLEK